MMTDDSNTSQPSPADLIEQALDVIMNRFDLDAERALKVLRSMSRETRTQMCVVAEQLINDNPSEAVRREMNAPLRLVPRDETIV
ncbi:ANTAR domain-containing protein [Mycobacterium sp. 852002-51971_SCH5477799-a]|uniref:ANTAR domain-containing protein n=1 Tax=Mycobacterium sp. 852002-51971_SCH5477799-a TaxID=1834106 RepID=UPI0018D2BF50|nr:ANTAR domain-containing protein [Mycobacterium sp. 852002-51971_SCH5477799-a]